jgi:hypothetical protein
VTALLLLNPSTSSLIFSHPLPSPPSLLSHHSPPSSLITPLPPLTPPPSSYPCLPSQDPTYWAGGGTSSSTIISTPCAILICTVLYRWDCEQSAQIWQSCADITIV